MEVEPSVQKTVGTDSTLCSSDEESRSDKIEVRDFEEALHYVGSWGRFQMMLTAFFLPFNLFLGYVSLAPILTNHIPPHWCKVPKLLNLTLDERRHLAIPTIRDDITKEVLYSRCSMYDVDWNRVLKDRKLEDPDPAWNTSECVHGWEFQTDDFHRTIASDLEFVCDLAWVPAVSQAVFFMGAIPGGLLFGWTSDHFGRIPVTMAANLLTMICGILLPSVRDHVEFLVLRFAMGLGFNNFWSQPYILILEYVDASKRTFVGNIGLALCLTFSAGYLPWLLNVLDDWKLFHYIVFSQFAVALATPWIIPESGRWLMSKGQVEKCITILKKVARINKKQVPEAVYRSLRNTKENNMEKRPEGSLKDLFATCETSRVTVTTVLLYMVICLIFDSTVRNISNLKFSLYVTFMISVGLELPADLLAIVGIDQLGRRWSAFFSLTFCGVFMLAAIPFLDAGDDQAVTVLCMVSRFFATYAINTAFQFLVEIMPTSLRSQGTSLGNTMAMLALVASPTIVQLSSYGRSIPFWTMGIISILGGIPSLLIPETAGIKLPETIEDMKKLGRDDDFFWMPIFGSKRRFKRKQENSSEIDRDEVKEEDMTRNRTS